jgi:hypothetical protein
METDPAAVRLCVAGRGCSRAARLRAAARGATRRLGERNTAAEDEGDQSGENARHHITPCAFAWGLTMLISAGSCALQPCEQRRCAFQMTERLGGPGNRRYGGPPRQGRDKQQSALEKSCGCAPLPKPQPLAMTTVRFPFIPPPDPLAHSLPAIPLPRARARLPRWRGPDRAARPAWDRG